MKKMNEFIVWAQGNPEKEGVYYVLGNGMKGVQQKRFSGKSWDVKEGEAPIVFGKLEGYKGGITSVYLNEIKYTKEHLKALHYECNKVLALMAVKEGKVEAFANVLVSESGKRHVIWTKPDDVIKDDTAEDFYEFALNGEPVGTVLPFVTTVASEPVEEKKATKKKAKETPKATEPVATEASKSEEPVLITKEITGESEKVEEPSAATPKEAEKVVPVDETPIEAVPEDSANLAGADITAEWGDDPIGIDDLPF